MLGSGDGSTFECEDSGRSGAFDDRGWTSKRAGRHVMLSCDYVGEPETRWKQVGVVRQKTRGDDQDGGRDRPKGERAETRRAASDRETRDETRGVSRERTIAREIRVCRERGARMS